MKIWKVSVASVMILTVTDEELQMVRQVVKEQNAELQEKNKEIAKLESQPK